MNFQTTVFFHRAFLHFLLIAVNTSDNRKSSQRVSLRYNDLKIVISREKLYIRLNLTVKLFVVDFSLLLMFSRSYQSHSQRYTLNSKQVSMKTKLK